MAFEFTLASAAALEYNPVSLAQNLRYCLFTSGTLTVRDLGECAKSPRPKRWEAKSSCAPLHGHLLSRDALRLVKLGLNVTLGERNNAKAQSCRELEQSVRHLALEPSAVASQLPDLRNADEDVSEPRNRSQPVGDMTRLALSDCRKLVTERYGCSERGELGLRAVT